MNHQEKKEILKQLNEQQFRQDVIIPLLSKMGYLAPTEYHGPNERGKDIICFEYDRLNEQRFLSVVAKTDDLTGNAATSAGLMTVVNQVQQAFDCPYENLYNMRQVFINEVWIMTTGRIISGAQDSVINSLRKHNLDKQIRIIGDDRLIELIDKHFSTYWNSSSETKESVIIQRDRLLAFIEKLLAANNVEKYTIESVKSMILNSSYEPWIINNAEGLHIGQVSAYSMELEKIDPLYDDYIVSKSYGLTSEILNEAKRNLRASFYDIEEVIGNADRISKMTDPSEFVEEADSYLVREDPFHKGWGRAGDFVRTINYMEEGLAELKDFKSFLEKKQKLDWVKSLSKSIATLHGEIESILNNNKEDEIIFNFSIDEDKKLIKIEYDGNSNNICFSIKEKRIEPGGRKRNKDGSIKPSQIVYSALHLFRNYVEELLNYDEFENEE